MSNAEETSVCIRCQDFIQKLGGRRGRGVHWDCPHPPRNYDVIIASTVTIGLALYQGCLPCKATIGYMTQ